MKTDTELLKIMMAGDRQAFAAHYDRYKISIYRYCLRILSDSAAAEDATHDTFLKMYSNAGTLRNPEALRSWLFSTARNEVMMFLRRQKRNDMQSEDTVWSGPTPHEVMVRTESIELIRALLQQLKPEYCEVLILREYERLSYTEIASITNSSESSVKSRLFKARKVLTEELKLYYT